MTSVVLMYVYYDNNKDIKAITPLPDHILAEEFSLAMFPVADVEIFLSGRRNPFDFIIAKVKKVTGETFKIQKKQVELFLTRTLDNYLTKVEPFKDGETLFKIINDVKESEIILKLDPLYKELYQIGTEEQQEDISYFFNSGPAILYFTEFNNPYNLIHKITYVPQIVFEKLEVVFPYDQGIIDLSNSSVYTKKIITNYGYNIRNY